MATASARKGNSSPIDAVIAAHEVAVVELATVKAWRAIGTAAGSIVDLAESVNLPADVVEAVGALHALAVGKVASAPNHAATRDALDTILKAADLGAVELSEGQRQKVASLKDREAAAAVVVSRGKGTRGGQSIPETFPHPLTVPATDGHKGYRGANRNAFQRALKDNATARGIDPDVVWSTFRSMPDLWADNANTATMDVAGIAVTRG